MRRFIALLVLAGAALLLAPPASAADRDSVDAYLRHVARKVEEPGVYVDPLVVRQGKLTSAQVDAIRAQARRQSSSLHILVLPASRLTGRPRGRHLGLPRLPPPPDLLARLHRVVGRPGTYALLTSAPTVGRRASRSTPTSGRAEARSTGPAPRWSSAIDCCAPDYAGMLRRFVDRSDVPRTASTHVNRQGHGPPPEFDSSFETSSGGIDTGGVFVVIVLIGVAVVGLALARGFSRSGSGRPSGPPPSVDELRAPLAQEIEQVRQEISAIDPTGGAPDPGVAGHVATARQALGQAHARSLSMSNPQDAQAVAAALADARYETAAATALRDGRPMPARTPPCFVDPRHGPSVTTRLYPPSGLNVPVPVCAACDASLVAGTQPVARSFQWGGNRYYPWMPYGPAWIYLMGYWGGQPFVQGLDHHASFVGGGRPRRSLTAAAPVSAGGGFGGGHHSGGGFGGGGHHGRRRLRWRHGWPRRRRRRRVVAAAVAEAGSAAEPAAAEATSHRAETGASPDPPTPGRAPGRRPTVGR